MGAPCRTDGARRCVRTLAAVSVLMRPSLAMAQTPGLVAAYAFNEASGATAADASGTGNNGVLTNGALFTAGKTGNGVGLDGVNDYVNLGNRASLRITGSMTLSAWVKSNAFPSTMLRLSQNDNPPTPAINWTPPSTAARAPLGSRSPTGPAVPLRGTVRPRWLSVRGITSQESTMPRTAPWPSI